MTAKEAIEILKIERDHMTPTLFTERIEAMDMAISALQAQDVPGTNVGSMISRQAAITEFSCCELTPDGGIDANYAIDFLKQLPSAQPEWNNHTVACLLAELFDDPCACNYNGIDEWLPEKCEVIDACPNPVGVACWEQYLKHRAERRTDEGD